MLPWRGWTSDLRIGVTRMPGKKRNASGTSKPVDVVQPDKGSIRVRMYRVGFGDCFLLTLPASKGSSSDGGDHILIDCGVHSQGDIGTIDKVVDDIADVTGKELAVIIATHAHQDHLAGYDRYASVFTAFKIGEVWLPWTWDPTNPEAVKLQKKHAALTSALVQHFEALGAAADPVAASIVENLKGNDHAISLLRAGFNVGAKVRYLKAGDTLNAPAGLTELAVRVLGPPTSEEFLAQMNPPSSQQYLRTSPTGPEVVNAIQAFPPRWRIPRDYTSTLSSQDEKEFQDSIGSPMNSLAFALDSARNNESVVALFAFRGRHLLFPGDAQYGNWEWWLRNADAENILPSINFLKVAHHGSINATPRQALEGMKDGNFAAMVPTQSKPWPSIPRVPLMARINTKSGALMVRSDWLPFKDAPKPLPGAEPREPEKPPSGFDEGTLWFDYSLSCD